MGVFDVGPVLDDQTNPWKFPKSFVEVSKKLAQNQPFFWQSLVFHMTPPNANLEYFPLWVLNLDPWAKILWRFGLVFHRGGGSAAVFVAVPLLLLQVATFSP